jgi:hypothetical protein
LAEKADPPTLAATIPWRLGRLFAALTGTGYGIISLAAFVGLLLYNEGVALPQVYWPLLGYSALILILPLILYIWLKPPQELIADLRTVTIMRKEIESLGRVNRNLVAENARLNQEIKCYRSMVRQGTEPDTILKRCAEIREARPEAKLTHELYVPFSESFRSRYNQGSSMIGNILLQDFIQVLPSQRRWCEEKGFILAEYLKRFPIAEAIDQLRFDILTAHWRETSFTSDQEVYDVNEYWEPSIYFWYLKRGDCESHATTLQALFLAAGLTDLLEMLTWNSCGLTFTDSEHGHSTVYAYSWVSKKWHHLEPLKRQMANRLVDLPEMHDSRDESNLKRFALSFNSQLTRKGGPE